MREESKNSTAHIKDFFLDLREKFQNNEIGIKDMEQSFINQMHCNKQVMFSYFEQRCGVDYLFIVFEDGFVDVFLTIYSIFGKRFNLLEKNKKFGVMIVRGYECDIDHFLLKLRVLFNVESAKKNLMRFFGIANQKRDNVAILFGACSNLGHHIWNEWCGLVTAQRIIPDLLSIPLILAKVDYLQISKNFLSVRDDGLFRGGRIFYRGRLLRFSSLVIAHHHRQFFDRQFPFQFEQRHFKVPALICIQLRMGGRAWNNIKEDVVSIIKNVISHFPEVKIVLDGYSKAPEMSWEDVRIMKNEEQMALSIKSAVPEAAIISIVGHCIPEKIPIYRSCCYFVGTIGSGGVIPAWLLQKAGIVFGPAHMHSWVKEQEAQVPEGGPFFSVVGALTSDPDNPNSCRAPVEELSNRIKDYLYLK